MPKNKRYYILLALLMFGLNCFYSCSERKRDNIFDPDNTNSNINLNFRIQQNSSGFKLNWNLPNINDIDSVIIYKSTNLSNSLKRYASLSATTINYIDNYYTLYEPVHYALSLKSFGRETAKTETISRIYGPNHSLVLTYHGFAIHEYSFDLQEISKTINLSIPYKYFDIFENRILVSSPIFDYLSYIDEPSTFERGAAEIKGAGSVLFINKSEFLLTTEKKPYKLYKFNNNFIKLDSFNLLTNKPVKILKCNDNLFALVDSSKITMINSNLQSINSQSFPTREIIDAQYNENFIYVELWSRYAENNLIIKVDPNSLSFNSLFTITGNAFTVNKDTIWAEMHEIDTELVKLLQNGTRLSTTEGLSNIENIVIHKPTNYIYVIERYSDLISLYNKTGKLIIKSKRNNSGMYDPIKIKVLYE